MSDQHSLFYEKPLRRLAPGHNAPIHDLVTTPEALAEMVVDHFAPHGRLLDPARGSGAFFRAMQRHSNDVEWCEVAAGRNFLGWQRPVDWIIGNPPWSHAKPFLEHAMKLADDIVFVITLPHVMTRARLRLAHGAGFGIVAPVMMLPQPPKPWPSSGFQLCAVHWRKGATSVFQRIHSESGC